MRPLVEKISFLIEQTDIIIRNEFKFRTFKMLEGNFVNKYSKTAVTANTVVHKLRKKIGKRNN